MSDNQWRLGERFELFGQLGTGAVGTVWRARDLRDGGGYAVKLLRPELVSDPQAVAELYRALDAVARIGHPGIVAADDAAAGEGWLALRSRLVDGESLRSTLVRHGVLDPATAAHVVSQACDALAAAHTSGIAHGDLHPGNILLGAGTGPGPEAVVTDFGLAALVNRIQPDHGRPAVPPIAYRAPESVTAGYAAGSAPADVYAIGVLLYECLTGQSRLAPVPGMPNELWSLVLACTSGNPHHRLTAAQLAASLRGFAGTSAGAVAGTSAAAGARSYQPVSTSYQAAGVAGPQAQPEAMTTRLPPVGADAGLGLGLGAASMPTAAEHTRVLGELPGFAADPPQGYPVPADPGRGNSGGMRLPALISAHKTESGIGAALVVVALLIGAALSLGGGGASASTASTAPAATAAAATTASQTPEAVVLLPGSASPSPSPSASASPSATAPVKVTFVNARSNTCMDTAGRIFADGTKEDIWACNGTPAQTWTLTPTGQLTEDGGAYCLDDYGLDKTPGTRVVLWSCNGGPNQRWTIQPNGAIVSVNAGLCVDVSGKGTQDGTPLVLWPCDGSPSQQWGSH